MRNDALFSFRMWHVLFHLQRVVRVSAAWQKNSHNVFNGVMCYVVVSVLREQKTMHLMHDVEPLACRTLRV